MQILKYILIAIDLVLAVAIVIITLLQHQDDAGLSATFTGASASNFLDKNKGRTKEGRYKKWTIIFGISLVVVSILLGTVYAL